MSFAKRRIATAFAVIGLASLVTFLQVEANHETDDQIGDEAVWSASDGDLRAIDQACKDAPTSGYTNCFIEQMGGYASSDAVAFSMLLSSQKASRLGYLAGMKESGLVDLGYVVYPGSGKSSPGWVLLNGVPSVVNVDDLAMLPKSEMEKDAQFRALQKDHGPLKLAVNDDQRSPEATPPIQQPADGGEVFLVPYSLQPSCAGCAPVGNAIFGFHFDSTGKLKKVKFLSIENTHS